MTGLWPACAMTGQNGTVVSGLMTRRVRPHYRGTPHNRGTALVESALDNHRLVGCVEGGCNRCSQRPSINLRHYMGDRGFAKHGKWSYGVFEFEKSPIEAGELHLCCTYPGVFGFICSLRWSSRAILIFFFSYIYIFLPSYIAG